MLTRRLFATSAAVALGIAAHLAGPASAQAEYPERPITILVPWDAGGGTDIAARIFAHALEQQVDVPVNVVNRSGGSGVVGHAAIVNATPDGYTLGVGSPELAFLKTVGLADITADSFTLMSRIALIPAGVTVAADAPWDDLQSFVDSVRSEPPLTYSGSGAGQGGSWHIAMAGLLTAAGLEPDRMKWIPSKGGAPALQDVVAGGVTAFTGSPVEALSLLEAGQVKTLALMTEERAATFPDVPTVEEAIGAPWVYGNFFALVGPKGLPEEVVERLMELGGKAAATAEFQDTMKERGVTPVWESRASFESFAEDYSGKVAEILASLGLAKPL